MIINKLPALRKYCFPTSFDYKCHKKPVVQDSWGMAAHQKKPPSAFRKSSCSLRYCFRVWMPNHICRQAENEDEDRWGSMRIRRIGSMEITQHAYLTWFHWSLHNEQRILSAAHGLGMSTPNVFGTQVKSSCISRSVPAQPHVAMHYFRQYIYRIYTQCLLVRVSQLQRRSTSQGSVVSHYLNTLNQFIVFLFTQATSIL